MAHFQKNNFRVPLSHFFDPPCIFFRYFYSISSRCFNIFNSQTPCVKSIIKINSDCELRVFFSRAFIMSNNTNLTSLLSDVKSATTEVSIRLSVEVIVIIFSISLVTCLIVQIRRGKEQFDSGFFHIYIILAICDTLGNLVVNFLL